MAAQRAAPQRAAAGVELVADLVARRAARVALGDQRRASLEDERLDLAGRTADGRGDLRVAQVAQLEEHQRPALIVGEPPEVDDQLAQLGPAPDVVGQAVEAGLVVVEGDGGLAPGREHRAAAVARDREEPRPHRLGRSARAQRAVSAHEGLLQRVLAVLAVAEHVPAERQQGSVMAFIESLERGLVAGAHQRGKALVVERDQPTRSDAIPENARHCEEDADPRRRVPARATRRL